MKIELTTVAKPWTQEARQQCDVLVDTATDVVLVYDSVARHYTRCHSLTADEQARLVERAKKKAAQR